MEESSKMVTSFVGGLDESFRTFLARNGILDEFGGLFEILVLVVPVIVLGRTSV